MEDIHHILKKYWGYNSFRSLQKEIIEAVLARRDVLALLPTGGGKSICFQVPALAQPGICLVITPLIALMKDQVEQLKKRKIPAAALFTGMSYAEIDLVLDNCVYGNTKFLYLSPERLKTELFQARVQKMQVNLLAVDEAHCISQWGYDFRPAYLDIAELRTLLPNVPIIALTATATRAVKQDIQDKLQFKNPAVFQKSFTRDNLSYLIDKTDNKERALLKLIKRINGATIIYVNTRKKSKLIADFLNKNNIKATCYHGGLNNAEREQRQDAWIQGRIQIIVATNAFGMGIDKPDVRLVVHLDLPTSLEAYYQEAGRAGRDEQKSYAIVLHDEQDIQELRENIQKENPSIDYLKKVYQHLANYYQLAVGTHDTNPHEFDLENFATTYRLKPQEAYQTIKKLEREGLIQLNEAFFQPTRLHITITHQELYAFQVAYAAYDPIIKAILRLYGGELFTDFCNISEEKIARYLATNSAEISHQLKKLQELGILLYVPQTDKPQITFTKPRYHADQIPLDIKSLEQKGKLNMQKAEAVIHYATHTARCRSQLLLEYFDEISYQPCKTCDLCLASLKLQRIEKDQNTARALILNHLQTATYELQELVDTIDMPEEIVIATIRQLLDQGALIYDQSHKLTKAIR
ncbi:MAG: recombinase RecQ [Candidatus Amoebophilus sp. 36-38]|nr:MAG: recombinase RecQ [Candidatus Amoebophilus sp. 36-38]